MMRIVHLVRHAPVAVDLERPSADWQLAPGAEPAVSALAARMRDVKPKRLVSSNHKKAIQTAEILTGALKAPIEVRPGLEEHHREQKDFFASRKDFDKAMSDFFQRPDEVVLGSESATMALDRFHNAIAAVMAETSDDEIIVSHGAVMALLLDKGGNGQAAAIWRRLGQPDYLKIDWPSLRIIDD